MEKQKQNKEKSFAAVNKNSFISVTLILVAMIAIAAIMSLIVPQGSFQKDANGETYGNYSESLVKETAKAAGLTVKEMKNLDNLFLWSKII